MAAHSKALQPAAVRDSGVHRSGAEGIPPIKDEHERRRVAHERRGEGLTLAEGVAQHDEEPKGDACLVCML